MIDFSKVKTAEQKANEARQAEREAALASRRAAYAAESDRLKFEAEYDALAAGTEPDYSAWIAAVAAIKERYPLPQ
ncbi:hypothetical protein [Pseudomonas sp. B21-035]|uniref:hypothetical protein n=1 Tax=Pseudomonas sp. B21-035 TaxID=2895484 RepID=UPI0021601CA6|nr:hypothetical protein [Pseudomonas sp. B21-035]UVL53931.1 hypothetical protein LOY22_13645 [Pseudomonas sp. B21-035]